MPFKCNICNTRFPETYYLDLHINKAHKKIPTFKATLSVKQKALEKRKGQIISECPYEIIVYPKIATKKFPRFLPWPLRRGQIKK